ncbi:MAG: AbrB/MazE/SpoVT family DNA-binding domain-containing protein, partial [Candidatus Hydrogenedentes bacterium]|nr:AbrB/MazE/SpoVT family DNA-binding domain-containing protein [Candidatus Hydrogenedentota bacterium]
MKTRVQKWGNSLAVRIPQSMAADLGLSAGSPAELRMHDGKLEVMPLAEAATELERLLELVTEDNLHGEIETGKPV